MGGTKITDEQRRSLHELARHSGGCTQRALLADGFAISQFVILVIEGFATMRRKRIDVGRLEIWLQITPIGQNAIA